MNSLLEKDKRESILKEFVDEYLGNLQEELIRIQR